MEEKEFREEMEKLRIRIETEKAETDKRTCYDIASHFASTLSKKMDVYFKKALMETKQEIMDSILNRYNVEMKILRERKERARRR